MLGPSMSQPQNSAHFCCVGTGEGPGRSQSRIKHALAREALSLLQQAFDDPSQRGTLMAEGLPRVAALPRDPPALSATGGNGALVCGTWHGATRSPSVA
jgi:hypothetical protein